MFAKVPPAGLTAHTTLPPYATRGWSEDVCTHTIAHPPPYGRTTHAGARTHVSADNRAHAHMCTHAGSKAAAAVLRLR